MRWLVVDVDLILFHDYYDEVLWFGGVDLLVVCYASYGSRSAAFLFKVGTRYEVLVALQRCVSISSC